MRNNIFNGVELNLAGSVPTAKDSHIKLGLIIYYLIDRLTDLIDFHLFRQLTQRK